MLKLLLTLVILLPPVAMAQVFTIDADNTTTFHPQHTPCFGNPAECAASANGYTSMHGAGTKFSESDVNPGKGIVYLRVTDAATNANPNPIGWVATMGGGPNSMAWGLNNTCFIIGSSAGASGAPYHFDPLNLVATRLYSRNGNTGTYMVPNSKAIFFSRKTECLVYAIVTQGTPAHPVLQEIDYNDASRPPTKANGRVRTLVDLAGIPHCLPSDFNATWVSDMSVSLDDNTFTVGLSNTGGQETGGWSVAWHRDTGCEVYNTLHGTWTDTNGVTVPIVHVGYNMTGTITLHGQQTTYDGERTRTGFQRCYRYENGEYIRLPLDIGRDPECNIPGEEGTSWYWLIGTNQVYHGRTLHFAGHGTHGAKHFVNQYGFDIVPQSPSPFMMRNVTSTAMLENSMAVLNPQMPNACPGQPDACPSIDQHPSWFDNRDGTDSAPFFTTTIKQPLNTESPRPVQYWDNEILAVPVTCYDPNRPYNGTTVGGICQGNTPWQIGYTYSDPNAQNDSGGQNFSDGIAAGNISQSITNGHIFYLLTTNWQRGFGCNNGYGRPATPQPCLSPLLRGTWVSCPGCVIVGNAGDTCTLSNFRSKTTGFAATGVTTTVTLSATNTIANNRAMTIVNAGSGVDSDFLNMPSTATVGNGTAQCADISNTLVITANNSSKTRSDVVIVSVPVTMVAVHFIHGTITGAAPAGVVVAVEGHSTVTDSAGNYTIRNVEAGSHTITPLLHNYAFTPPNIGPFTLNADSPGNNFTSARVSNPSYEIKGRVVTPGPAGLAGITVSVTGTNASSTTTDGDGYYSLFVPVGTYTLIPTSSEWTVNPGVIGPFSLTAAGYTASNFSATQITGPPAYVNRGTITVAGTGARLWGVAVRIARNSDNIPFGEVTTLSNGTYSFDCHGCPWTKVIPTLSGFTFNPVEAIVSGAGTAVNNFIATPVAGTTYTISGIVTNLGAPLTGVAINLSGAVIRQVYTDRNGSYSFDNLTVGNTYTVTPQLATYTFDPANQSLTISTNVVQNFEATRPPPETTPPASLKIPHIGPSHL